MSEYRPIRIVRVPAVSTGPIEAVVLWEHHEGYTTRRVVATPDRGPAGSLGVAIIDRDSRDDITRPIASIVVMPAASDKAWEPVIIGFTEAAASIVHGKERRAGAESDIARVLTIALLSTRHAAEAANQ